jgi:hypothetical protein
MVKFKCSCGATFEGTPEECLVFFFRHSEVVHGIVYQIKPWVIQKREFMISPILKSGRMKQTKP